MKPKKYHLWRVGYPNRMRSYGKNVYDNAITNVRELNYKQPNDIIEKLVEDYMESRGENYVPND